MGDFVETPVTTPETWNCDGTGNKIRRFIGPWNKRREFIIPTTYGYGTTGFIKDSVSILGLGKCTSEPSVSAVIDDITYDESTVTFELASNPGLISGQVVTVSGVKSVGTNEMDILNRDWVIASCTTTPNITFTIYCDNTFTETYDDGSKGSVATQSINVYPQAVIEVNYTRFLGTQLANDKGLDDSWEVNISRNVEHIALPKRRLYWISDHSLVDNVSMVKIVPHMSLILTHRNAISSPEAAMAVCQGTINNAVFLGYATGSLLFMGGDTRGTIDENGVSRLSYSLRFEQQLPTWNQYWNSDKSIYDTPSPSEGYPNGRIYQSTNFSGLIA